ncbi:MAG: hypothetical protein MI673_06250, partial [Thiotrichales bacterium]|nr:hypothetical protein [Thiotrichales bacterium]
MKALRHRWVGAVLFLAALALATYGALYSSLYFILDPSFFHEEIRIGFRYLRLADPALFPDDDIARYLEANDRIVLFKWLNWAWARLGGDLATLHLNVLPLALWLAFLLGVYAAARGMGGQAFAWGALVIALSQTNVLYQILSSTPHGFAFPLLVWTLALLQQRRPVAAAVCCVATALVYPPSAPIAGLALAWFLLFGGEAARWSWRRKALVLAVTGALSGAAVAAALPGANEFGQPIAPLTQSETYPEAGPEGRYFKGTQKPIVYTVTSMAEQFRLEIGDDRLAQGLFALYALLCVVFVLSGWGGQRLAARHAFTAGSVLAGLLGLALMYHSAYRFLYYPLHILLIFAVPLVCERVLRRFASARGPLRRFMPVSLALLVLLFSLTMDSFYPGGGKRGLSIHHRPEQRQVLAFLKDTPKDALVAGWPTGIIESVPFFAKRSAFVLNKTHYPTHTGYVMEMR